MKPRILVTRDVFEDVLGYLRGYFEVTANQEDTLLDPGALARLAADQDGLMTALTERVDEALLAGCPKLRAVCNIAVGYNNIDVPACTRRGVLATNTPGVLDESTADLAWALILGAARRVTEAETYLRAGRWKRWELKQLLGTDVHHATLGVIGMGRIGQAIARRAAGFEMRVIYHNRSRLDAGTEQRLNAAYVSMEQLLEQADFVVLQVPYSPATHHLIGEAEFRRMKPSAILVNTARGGVVDDAALVRALKDGTIRGAGLDVFENEPALNPGFLELKNVVLLPHIGSSTDATRHAMAMTAAKNLVAALTGARPPNLLNPEALGVKGE